MIATLSFPLMEMLPVELNMLFDVEEVFFVGGDAVDADEGEDGSRFPREAKVEEYATAGCSAELLSVADAFPAADDAEFPPLAKGRPRLRLRLPLGAGGFSGGGFRVGSPLPMGILGIYTQWINEAGINLMGVDPSVAVSIAIP